MRAKRLWLITKAVAKATWLLIPINLFSAFLSHVLKFDEWGKVLVQSLGNVLWLIYEEWKRQSAALPPEVTIRLEPKLVVPSGISTVKAPKTKATSSRPPPRRRLAWAILTIAVVLGLLLFVAFYVYLYRNTGVNPD
jgi:hypothetical protein